MTVLHGRKLAGKAWQVFPNGILVTPPTLVIRSIAGQTTGGASAVSLSFAGGAPETLAATVDGVPVAISGVSILTASGAAGAATGTATLTIDTPSAGSHAVVVSSAGIFAARSDPFTLVTAAIPPPPPPPPPVPPGTAPPVLSGVTITQHAALWPGQNQGTPVAYCDPIGGIGPFLWGLTDPSGLYHIDATTGDITVSSGVVGSGTETLTVSCYDGRVIAKGQPYAPATQTFTPAKLGASASGMHLNSRNPVHNCSLTRSGAPSPQDGPYVSPCAYGADHSFSRDNVNVADPAGKWGRHTSNQTQWKVGQPVVGSYPVTFNSVSPGGDTQTLTTALQVVQFTPVTYIELYMFVSIISTATLVGTVIGRLLATTPNNLPSWSWNDPSGTVTVNSATGDVTLVKAPTLGTLQFNASVLDGLATFTQTVSVPVRPGVIVPASNMTLAVNPGLDNSRRNQTVGTPTVTGVPGVQKWVIASQTGYNLQATLDVHFGNPARYQIDARTGAITTAAANAISTAAMLSYQRTDYNYVPDQIVVSCSDGINTCTRTFTIPVAEAPTTYYHVERGTNPQYLGISGTDITRTQAMTLVAGDHPGVKIGLIIYAHPEDPEFYTDWTRSYRGFTGPGAIYFVAVNGNLPLLGGSSTNSLASSGISAAGGKGHLVFTDGDWEVFGPAVISGVHNGSPGDRTNADAISKDGNTWGNLYISKMRLINNDQGVHSGNIHGFITVDNCDLCQNGGSQVSAGLTHNAYIGSVTRVTFRGTVSRRIAYGHLIKCRAVETIIDNCRIWDSSSGSAANCVNLPYIGQVSITNSHLAKSVFASNPFAVNAGEDGPLYDINAVTISNCVMDLHSIAASGSGAASGGSIVAVNHWHLIGNTGAPSTVAVSNNTVSLAPFTVMTSDDTHYLGGAGVPVPLGTTVETGTTRIPIPPAFDMTDPVTGGTLPSPMTFPRPFRHRNLGGDNALWGTNWLNQTQMHDVEDFRVGRTSAAGTAVCTIRAMGDIIDNPTGDPFAGATVYTVLTTPGVSATNPNCYDTTGWAVTSNPDGSGVLKTAATGLTPGLHFVQVRSVSADGTHTFDGRYPVVVT